MSKLKELKRRLQVEPDNLGLRVLLAGAMREAGRLGEAVELYRSVALAYRDQGRTQQAIAVCRSILELAPDDVRCHALLATLVAGKPDEARARAASVAAPAPVVRAKTADELAPDPEIPTLRPRAASATPAPIPSIPSIPAPARPRTSPPGPPPRASESGPVRRSSFDETPLPVPLPYHVADPTTKSLKKLSGVDLPTAENVPTRPGSERTLPELTGIANAARRISASLIAANRDEDDISIELDTREHPRIEPADLAKISAPPPTVPVERVDLDEDALTPPPLPPVLRDSEPPEPRGSEPRPMSRDSDEEQTMPRDLPRRVARGTGALGSTFFEPLPLERRAAVLSRFNRRSVRAGTTVIRQGEQGHSLVLVASGRLEIRAERPDGTAIQLGAVGAGEYVGEAALLARGPALAHVIALTDVDLLLLQPRDFYEIAGAFPALWAELKDVAERRTREHEARLRR